MTLEQLKIRVLAIATVVTMPIWIIPYAVGTFTWSVIRELEDRLIAYREGLSRNGRRPI